MRKTGPFGSRPLRAGKSSFERFNKFIRPARAARHTPRQPTREAACCSRYRRQQTPVFQPQLEAIPGEIVG